MSFISDLITLDVITVTGDMTIITKKKDSGDSSNKKPDFIIDFKQLFGREGGKTTINGNLRVIAATHVEVDKDTLTFVASDLNENERELLDMHLKTVAAAGEARANIVARLKPLFKREGKLPGAIE
ncbi:hypothetical protein [Neolewinella persica]|uniref:hypothetical protein n=1 Tax=Neolewinella persica TaxID=70998 RepID=UPI00035F0685|nr:hypothetical protein [Neolewinella persica]